MTNLMQFGDLITPPYFNIKPTLDMPIISGNYFYRIIILYALICLASTIIIELVVALIMGVRGKDLCKIILAQVVTNPPVVFISNFVLYGLSASLYLPCVIILEIAAIVVEYWIYKNFLKNQPKKGPLALSIICNVVSFILGFMLFGIF